MQTTLNTKPSSRIELAFLTASAEGNRATTKKQLLSARHKAELHETKDRAVPAGRVGFGILGRWSSGFYGH